MKLRTRVRSGIKNTKPGARENDGALYHNHNQTTLRLRNRVKAGTAMIKLHKLLVSNPG
jgi:hypothetical protein